SASGKPASSPKAKEQREGDDGCGGDECLFLVTREEADDDLCVRVGACAGLSCRPGGSGGSRGERRGGIDAGGVGAEDGAGRGVALEALEVCAHFGGVLITELGIFFE